MASTLWKVANICYQCSRVEIGLSICANECKYTDLREDNRSRIDQTRICKDPCIYTKESQRTSSCKLAHWIKCFYGPFATLRHLYYNKGIYLNTQNLVTKMTDNDEAEELEKIMSHIQIRLSEVSMTTQDKPKHMKTVRF